LTPLASPLNPLTPPPTHPQVENRLQVEGQRIPNLTHPDVPVSNDEDAATVLSLVRGGGG